MSSRGWNGSSIGRTDLSRRGSSRIWRCLNSRADSNPGRLNAPPTHHVFIRIRPAISRRSRVPGSCEETWSTHSRSRPERSRSTAGYAPTPGFVDFPADVEAAFETLTPIQQRGLLIARRNWTVLRDPAFVPMLRRLASGASEPGPQDIALRLLYDLAPGQGRQIALRELGKRDSSVGISGLSVLPDRQLPSFDSALVAWLEQARTAEEYGQALDRIQRFATGRIVTRVRRVYERFKGARSCTLAPAALAYFFRVAPAYARAEIGNVMKEVGEGERCETGVMPAIAQRRMGPALEKTAISHLSHSEGWVVADAASMLQRHGSPRAEAPLWQALDRWHTRWKDRAAKLEMDQDSADGMPWEEENERYLTTALMEGTAWLLNEPSGRRLTSLCVTRLCKETVERAFRSSETNSNIAIYPSELPLGEPTLFAHEQTSVMLRSREALRRWLSLHEKGTTFTWKKPGRQTSRICGSLARRRGYSKRRARLSRAAV